MTQKRQFYFSPSRHEERQALSAIDAMAQLRGISEPVLYTDSAPLDWPIGDGQRDDAVHLGIGVELNYPACKGVKSKA